MKFDIILTDIPRTYNNFREKLHGSPVTHYSLMTDDELKKLPVNQIANDNSVLLYWSVAPRIKEDIEILESWGFKFITIPFVWVKKYKDGSDYCGLGHWARSGTEFVLMGKKGKGIKRKSANVRQVFYASVLKPHSSKPKEVYEKINQLFGVDCSKIELFARNCAPGWIATGFEYDKKDIRNALKEMINGHS